MKKALAFAMLAALSLVGRAEDPKPEEKKDPFREFKLGDLVCNNADARLVFADARVEKVKKMPLEDGESFAFRMNCKSACEKPVMARLSLAWFDSERRLVRVDREWIRSTGSTLQPRESGAVEIKFSAEEFGRVHLWQMAVEVVVVD